MHEVIERIVGLGANLDTCVCVGVGGVSLAAELAALRPARLVLLEGNEEAAAQIKTQLSQWPAAELHSAVVAPHAGTVTWHRYNLPLFDGPLDAAPLARFFPRLARTSETHREAAGMGEWLASLNLRPAELGSINVLVLALPGQEAGLLHGVAPELLESFDAVVLQGCSDLSYAGSSTLAAVLFLLRDRGFLSDEAPGEQPLWFTAVARLDRQHLRAMKLERRVGELAAALGEQQALYSAQLAALQHSIQEAERCAAELQARVQQAEESRFRAEQLAQERQTQVQQLVEARAAAEQMAHETLIQLEPLVQAKEAAERAAAERHAQLQELTEAKAAAEHLAHQRLLQLDELMHAKEVAERAAADTQSQLQQFALAKANAEQLAEENRARFCEMELAKSAAEALAAECQAQVQQLSEQKAAAEQLANGRQAQLDSLAAANAQAEARAVELATRSAQLEAERGELEAQVGRLRDEVALARAAHEGAEELALEFGGKLKEAMRLRDSRSAEVADLRQQLEQALGRLDEERAAAHQRADEAQAQRLRIAQLEAELRDNRRALNAAVRTQALREQDLRELQERYAAIQREQDATQELVTRLAERLTVAQRYFDQLTAESSSGGPSLQVAAAPEGTTRSGRARKPSKVEAIASSRASTPAVRATAGPDASGYSVPAVDAAAPAAEPSSKTAQARRRRDKKAAASTTG